MPKKNVALTIDIGLVDSGNRPQFKANPTLASGDFKVSLDGGNYANLGTLPTVTNSGKVVRVAFSQSEMNHDTITLVASDATGSEWDDQIITFNTTANTVDDVYTAVQSVLTKLLKYVQLMVRKDAAIATDNATELTAINADGGSGAGAFASTTDSQEAIRDATTTAPSAAAVATAVWQDTTAGDFTVSGSIGKSLFTSGAVPGASGGLLIAGTNAATTFSGIVTFSAGVTITQSSSNASALVITGNGTGHGVSISSGSGATGNGVNIVSAATNGKGVNIAGVGTGAGLYVAAGSGGNGVEIVGGSSSGDGVSITCTSGDGIDVSGGTAGHGIKATGGATGNGLYALGGASTGDGLRAEAQGTGDGIDAVGLGSGGVGLKATGGTNAAGMVATGAGTGNGFTITAGATGNGLSATGGATSGDGARFIAATSGDGLQATGAGGGLDLNATITSQDAAVTASVDDASATASSFYAATGLSATDDFYNGMWLAFTGGTNQGHHRKISDYTGSTRRFQFTSAGSYDTPFLAAPANTDTFVIYGKAPT